MSDTIVVTHEKGGLLRDFVDEPVGVTASKLVTGDRQESYGDPLANYEMLARMLQALFGFPVSRRQAITVPILMKLCRDASKPKRDNEVDICGYAHILQMDREQMEVANITKVALRDRDGRCVYCRALPGDLHHLSCERA